MPNKRKQLTGTTRLSRRQTSIPGHPAAIDDYEEGSFYKIPIDLIRPNPHQPRDHFDKKALNELAASIKQNGIIQALAVQKDSEENIILLAGERRLRAAKIAELTEVPAVFIGGNPAEIALIENVQRQNLNPIEEARAYERIMSEHEYTQEKLAQIVGKSRVIITETLSLNKLPNEIKKECRRVDTYSKRLLIEVARQKTPKGMISLFNKAKKASLKSDQVKEIARKKRGAPVEIASRRLLEAKTYLEKQKIDNQYVSASPEFRAVVEDLRDYLNKILE
jgi:ParB family chromosome partitioning protein